MVTKRVSHRRREERPTVQQLLRRLTRRLAGARLHYGHGTDSAAQDAATLVFHVLGVDYPVPDATLERRPTLRERAAIDALVQRRIRERIPAVYLTGRIWFAGLPMYIDPRALIPRSPIAELIEQRFEPWVDPQRVRRILDVGTGSGCIAIACALAFPRARVDAVDISPEALQVARINRKAHGLSRRLRLLQSDYFSALEGPPYDIIVSNPPYVGTSEFKGLPAEYAHEPEGALRAGRDGMAAVRVLLAEAARHLTPHGVLVVEVGNTETTVRRQFRHWPLVWLEFARGGGGVFVIGAEQLRRMTQQ